MQCMQLLCQEYETIDIIMHQLHQLNCRDVPKNHLHEYDKRKKVASDINHVSSRPKDCFDNLTQEQQLTIKFRF